VCVCIVGDFFVMGYGDLKVLGWVGCVVVCIC